MGKKFQFLHGTTQQINDYVGDVGELVVDIEAGRLVLFSGDSQIDIEEGKDLPLFDRGTLDNKVSVSDDKENK